MITRVLSVGILVYLGLVLLTRLLEPWLNKGLTQESPWPTSLSFLALFVILLAIAVYLGHCLFSRKVFLPDINMTFAYAGVVAFAAPIGEILIDTSYTFFLGEPLWIYHLFPVHQGYTSQIMFFLWAICGAHMYQIRCYIGDGRPHRAYTLALIIAFEAIAMECFVNILSIAMFGDYLFYYSPSDLLHLSTFVALPFYVAFGYVGFKILKKCEKAPWISGSLGFVGAFIVLFVV